VTGETVMVVKGLVERDAADKLMLMQGLAVCWKSHRTAWLAISDSNFDVQSENSSL
jgi:hypothetical protein